MSDDEQTIHNPAPNQGVQGHVHSDVHTGSSYDQQNQGVEGDQYNAGRDIIMVDTAHQPGGRARRMPWTPNPDARSPRLRGDLHTQPTAVAPQWQLHLHGPTRSRDIPAGTPIAQIFDQASGELLILGAPGAGKTTLLLELARALLARAQADAEHPIPVARGIPPAAQRRPAA